MSEPVFTVFDRFLCILIAVVFYLAIKFLQTVQDDIEEVKRLTDERLTRIENILYGGE